VGSFGRLYLGGEERDILAAERSLLAVLKSLPGRSLPNQETKE